MAILIEEEKRSINWFPVALGVIALLAILAGMYYLFFAPVPGIDVVLPKSLQAVSKIPLDEITPSAVIQSTEFGKLRSFTGPPSTGDLGRSNPFIPF